MDEEYVIRRAQYEDIPSIMNFINEYWKKDHILAIDREFFEYQHYFNEEISYIIAENIEDKAIEGILGYIVYSEEKSRDLFGAIWKVKSNKYPMLGMKMQIFAVKELNARTFSAISLNPTTLEMHRRWGAVLGRLKQYYILADLDTYNIAKIVKKDLQEYHHSISQFELKQIVAAESLKPICYWEEINNKIPRKSFKFIKHRYFQRPVYKYLAYAIHNGEEILGVFIMREIECRKSKILRIIDYLGDTNAINHTGKALRRMINENAYEYLDFYEFGIDESVLKEAGFVERKEGDCNIIPNYFEPYIQKNIDIDFYTSSKTPVLLFKGDGDQDRPNKIERRKQSTTDCENI